MGNKKKIDYVYILGASHSGSTLLALLLNAHPDVTTMGESAPSNIGDIDTYRCSCGKIFNECLFWKRVAARMRADHPDFSLDNFGTKFELPSNPVIHHFLRFEHRGLLFESLRDTVLHLSPHWTQSQRNIMARCYDLASAVLAESGRHIFVDSSKLAHRLKFLARIPEFNIKAIHLVRDGRAVALTYMRPNEFADSKEPALRKGGRGMEGAATADAMPMKQAANEWRRCLRSAEHVLAGLEKSQWIRVYYDELCNDTEGTLDKIYNFIGTNSGSAVADLGSVERHILGNGMRLNTEINVSLDERWKSVLTEGELRIFDREASKVNRRYGYA
ncbi:sulfotransferase [Planctomycetota bacterium]